MDRSKNRGECVIKRRYFIALILILFFPTSVYAADVTWGGEQLYKSGNADWTRIVEIDTNKFVVAYRENNASGEAIVGSVSGTTISWGSIVQFDSDIGVLNQNSALGLARLDTDKFVVAYADDSAGDDGFARVTTVTGVEIDGFGTASEFETGDTHYIDACQLDTDKFVVVFSDEPDGNDGKARVGTATGTTTITWGTTDEYESGGATGNSCAQLDTDKFMVCWRQASDTNGDSVVYTVSTRTLTEGTHVEFADNTNTEIGWGWPIDSAKIDTDKFVVAWHDSAEIYKARIGTVATTTISYDEVATTINEDTLDSVIGVAVAVIDTSNILFAYIVESPSNIATNLASISGSAMIMSGEEIAVSNSNGWPAMDLISSNKVALGFEDRSESSDGKAQIGDVSITPPATGAPQVIMIMSEEKREEKIKQAMKIREKKDKSEKVQWVLAKFKEDYASGKIKE